MGSRQRKRSGGSGRATPKRVSLRQIEEYWAEWPGDDVAAAKAGEYLGALAGLVEARKGLEVEISGMVRATKALGASWGDLGKVLGVTPQAVQQRYGSPAEATPSGRAGAVKGRP